MEMDFMEELLLVEAEMQEVQGHPHQPNIIYAHALHLGSGLGKWDRGWLKRCGSVASDRCLLDVGKALEEVIHPTKMESLRLDERVVESVKEKIKKVHQSLGAINNDGVVRRAALSGLDLSFGSSQKSFLCINKVHGCRTNPDMTVNHALLEERKESGASANNNVTTEVADWSATFEWDARADDTRFNIFGISSYRANQRELISFSFPIWVSLSIMHPMICMSSYAMKREELILLSEDYQCSDERKRCFGYNGCRRWKEPLLPTSCSPS
ncbi:Mediator of RNA polymerase II transcription subunit 34 [Platanthera guangdongensis]|uniref:Mediator of RNA polymerase II transcription subunit 34 n=1 Tax=Platanthera guangdongensis TaxID=2320717 RepID=A0ABR2M5D5_9ASPA